MGRTTTPKHSLYETARLLSLKTTLFYFFIEQGTAASLMKKDRYKGLLEAVESVVIFAGPFRFCLPVLLERLGRPEHSEVPPPSIWLLQHMGAVTGNLQRSLQHLLQSLALVSLSVPCVTVTEIISFLYFSSVTHVI